MSTPPADDAEPATEPTTPDPDDGWAEQAAGWDNDPMTQAYADAALSSLVVVLDKRQHSLARADVCDFGCGTGLLTERLTSVVSSITAVDISPAMLAQLQRKVDDRGWGNVTLVRTLSPTTEPFDLIVCSSVLGFVDDYPSAVRELVGYLRPGGLLVQWDWERDDSEPEPHGLTTNEINVALTEAGCVDVHSGIGFEVTVDDAVMRPLIGVGQKPAI